VPEICRFLGIVITMYHREHEPPHFHARYSGHKITVRIADGAVEGELPATSLGPRDGVVEPAPGRATRQLDLGTGRTRAQGD
jgi:hypothetical protein